MTGEPVGQAAFVLDLHLVHGVLLVDLFQGQGVRRSGGIGGVDPVDERLLIPKYQGRPIEHDPTWLRGAVMAASQESGG